MSFETCTSDHLPLQGSLTLHGPVRVVGPGRVLVTEVTQADGHR